MTTSKQTNLIELAATHGVVIENIEEYQNKNNIIKCKCKNGHYFENSVEYLLKTGFECLECLSQFQLNILDTTPYFLSLDAATYTTGMSIFNKDGQLLGHKAFEVSRRDDYFDRLKIIVNEIYNICIKQNIKCVILEDIQYQSNPQLYKKLAMLQGVLRYWIINVLHIELITAYPDEWRSYNHIYGVKRVEQKLACMTWTKQVFKKDIGEDESDSIGLGIYGIHQFHSNKTYRED